jgi:hypothetical protein
VTAVLLSVDYGWETAGHTEHVFAIPAKQNTPKNDVKQR